MMVNYKNLPAPLEFRNLAPGALAPVAPPLKCATAYSVKRVLPVSWTKIKSLNINHENKKESISFSNLTEILNQNWIDEIPNFHVTKQIRDPEKYFFTFVDEINLNSKLELLDVLVAGHIGDLGLRLAVEKTEAVVFKAQYGPADLRLCIGDQAVQLCAALKHLEVVHEGKGMWYGAHYRAAADKARRILAALRGLMPNIGGPREPRKRLLLSVVHSVMLYGAPTRGAELWTTRPIRKRWLASRGL
ncbi:Reverse transcriptase domain-containing protein [Aphis craccivora]|uniref:Reverse transcriptase domain-containing protein n=1 Tax=Aphis craccivora TaxID=307492 RepID=A0A6G0VPW1_APHCR|nr:Reverse transcriptase domain-containing protein [Aphis craccivora]